MGKRNRLAVAGLLVLAVVVAADCGAQSVFEKGIAAYRSNELEKALPLFEQAVEEAEGDADAHAYLAETYRRTGKKEEAVRSARDALGIDPCHSFAHTVIADARNPMFGMWGGVDAESTWQHLLKAVACDSMDGNAWTGIWIEAMRRKEPELEKKALRLLIRSGFLASPLLSYNRWVLTNLPRDALLLTNGDMDTYPAVALQEVQKIRPDVCVANLSLLNLPWYARVIRDRYGVPLPFKDKELDTLRPRKSQDGGFITASRQIVKGWIDMQKAGQFPRPITVAATVRDREFTPGSKNRMKLAGPFYLCLAESASVLEDTSIIRTALAGIEPSHFAGSLVGSADRSPVRIGATDQLVTNITALAIRYGYSLLESGYPEKAGEWAEWAGEFERKTKAGPVMTEQIEELRKAAREKM